MQTQNDQAPRWVIYLTLGLVVIVAIVFVSEFVVASTRSGAETDNPSAEVTPEDVSERVVQVLLGADVANGQRLVQEAYECHVCHIDGGGRIAPAFVGIAQRAETEVSGLNAAEYIYQSIVYPDVHVVKGYSNAMPANYPSRLTEREIGDIVAYLLTQ